MTTTANNIPLTSTSPVRKRKNELLGRVWEKLPDGRWATRSIEWSDFRRRRKVRLALVGGIGDDRAMSIRNRLYDKRTERAASNSRHPVAAATVRS